MCVVSIGLKAPNNPVCFRTHTIKSDFVFYAPQSAT